MKLLVLFAMIAAGVAAILYAHVDLGMSYEQLADWLRSTWLDRLKVLLIALWGPILFWWALRAWDRRNEAKQQ